MLKGVINYSIETFYDVLSATQQIPKKLYYSIVTLAETVKVLCFAKTVLGLMERCFKSRSTLYLDYLNQDAEKAISILGPSLFTVLRIF